MVPKKPNPTKFWKYSNKHWPISIFFCRESLQKSINVHINFVNCDFLWTPEVLCRVCNRSERYNWLLSRNEGVMNLESCARIDSHHPSPLTLLFHAQNCFSVDPSHRSIPFLLQDWLPGLFTDTTEHILFLHFTFLIFSHSLVVGSMK